MHSYGYSSVSKCGVSSPLTCPGAGFYKRHALGKSEERARFPRMAVNRKSLDMKYLCMSFRSFFSKKLPVARDFFGFFYIVNERSMPGLYCCRKMTQRIESEWLAL